MRVIHNTVETVKQEDGRELRIVNGPCPGIDAGLKQFDQMIYRDIVDQAFARGGTGIVQPNGVEVAGDTGRGPRCQLSLEVVCPLSSRSQAIESFFDVFFSHHRECGFSESAPMIGTGVLHWGANDE